jgi:hypothetical protein
MATSEGSHHQPPPGTALGSNCPLCGHAALAHSYPPDAQCAICVLLEDMARVLLSMVECSICLALVRPESKADHEHQHLTNTNRPMTEQRERRAVMGPGAGSHS